jgi:DNA-binding XRE family transcriptional regulator
MSEQDGRGLPVPYLKAWRDWRLLTQKELADKAKVSEATIVSIENGANARLITIRKLATALGITAEELAREMPGPK